MYTKKNNNIIVIITIVIKVIDQDDKTRMKPTFGIVLMAKYLFPVLTLSYQCF